LRDRYARAAKESRISWIVSLPPETVRIIADEPAIERRVLGNLVENALRHTPSGGTVEVGYRIEDKTFVGFVRDTGPGISKENLPKLFCPGTQLDPNTKGLAGLGLASVKAVIESHHGRVWVESEPGRATTFYFVLPVQDII
jgi:two-component system sensor histidine kinase BaeS